MFYNLQNKFLNLINLYVNADGGNSQKFLEVKENIDSKINKPSLQLDDGSFINFICQFEKLEEIKFAFYNEILKLNIKDIIPFLMSIV